MVGKVNLKDLSVDELRRELRARAKHMSSNQPTDTFRSLEGIQKVDTHSVVRELKDKQKAIYGTDNRSDLFLMNDPLILGSADGVVAICQKGDIVDNGDGTSTLRTREYVSGNVNRLPMTLCTKEVFRGQPLGCFCSGFLIAPDIVATAGHCIDYTEEPVTALGNVRFVFGFRMKDNSTARTVFNNNDIYSGKRTIARALSNGVDWAIVQLDRPVANHKPLHIRFGRVKDNQGLYVIGHPAGLPTKFADGANVRDNTPGSYYIANLDTYGGNSGSPVFNRDSHVVEGILVRGEEDYEEVDGCAVSLVCPTTGCRGEDCTRISEFQNAVELPVPSKLESKSSGLEVMRLQSILKSKGFDAGIIDGKFGPKTESSVKGFQKANGLQVDGIVGKKTWKALLE